MALPIASSKILVVDDEPQIRRVLRVDLSSKGYIVDDARSAEEALAQVTSGRPDLILLDINMPRVNGLEACRMIRRVSDAAIVMLTVRNSEEDKVAALDAGADDFVSKPFSMPELLARIRANLRRVRTAKRDERVFSFDDIEIDLSTRRASVAGKEKRFTPKEFELLTYLITNPNIVIPHAKLLDAVWGPEYSDDVQYLHVFVRQLRKKIEPDHTRPRYILTEPWVGYRFYLPDAPRDSVNAS